MIKFSYLIKSCIGLCVFLILAVILLLGVEHLGGRPNFPVFSSLHATQTAMRHKTQLLTLSFFIPDFTGLVEFQKNGHPLKQDQWEEYKDYYQKVSDVMPYLPEIYNLLGICSYYMGNTSQAIDFYQKAIKQNHDFFWPYYNLGVLLYKNGRIRDALSILGAGLKTDPIKNFSLVALSPIFTQIFPWYSVDGQHILENIKNSLQAGYKNGYILYGLGCYEIKSCPRRPPVDLTPGALEPKIF